VEPPISPGILDDAHALAIGRIALAFGDLELIATYFLSPLIGSDGWVGPLVIGGQAIAWQLDKIRQLAPRRLDAEAATRALAWATAVKDAAERRNRIMHNPWVQDEDQLVKLGFTRKGLADESVATLDDLHALRSELERLADQGFELVKSAADVTWPRSDGQPRS
jgi:hypothetical protein